MSPSQPSSGPEEARRAGAAMLVAFGCAATILALPAAGLAAMAFSGGLADVNPSESVRLGAGYAIAALMLVGIGVGLILAGRRRRAARPPSDD